MRRSNHKGFTLTELLVVIAILGLLAALILTGISQGKAKAQRVQCAHNVRQIGLALSGFVAENGVYPLYVNAHPDHDRYPEHNGSWVAALQHSGLARSARHINSSVWLHDGVWQCPSAHAPVDLPRNTDYLSYGYNAWGLSHRMDTNALGLGGHFVWKPPRLPAPPVPGAEVVCPSDMIAIGDGFMGGDGVIQDGGLLLWRTRGLQDKGGSTRRSHSRHQERANVVFCDGHVEAPSLKFLFDDSSDRALIHWNRDHLPHRDRL